MKASLEILRAGPLATIQDIGRPGYLTSGLSASGPMDRTAFNSTGALLNNPANTAIEFTTTGLTLRLKDKPVEAAFGGGIFNLSVNDLAQPWPCNMLLQPGDEIAIKPGPKGNYGYLRCDHEIDVPKILGSYATNLTAGLGGLEGRALVQGDVLSLTLPNAPMIATKTEDTINSDGSPIRFIWGIHADKFDVATRTAFASKPFEISTSIDRMGARLTDPSGVFTNAHILSLVSDAVVPGDIQILGDGTPIVLLRDHQPTGGYPRIGTVISADLDRLVQIRPRQEVRFQPVTLQKAHAALLGKGR